MAKVILICGRICSGKSTYAQQLCRRDKAVLLSIDEIMLALFDPYLGDLHDTYTAKTEQYLLDKAAQIATNGINVVLDWGFWQKEKRKAVRSFFKTQNILCQFHYIDISDENWHARIDKRNHAVLAGEETAYFIDQNLAAKAAGLFEPPKRDEIDVWVSQ